MSSCVVDLRRCVLAAGSFGMRLMSLSGGYEIGGTSDTDVRPTVERSIYLGEPVLIVVPNYRLNGK
jgi:hypothetical protein